MLSIEWLGDRVRFLDQTQLPLKEVYIETSELHVLIDAIVRLKVRGAPLLGISAAYGILLGVLEYQRDEREFSLERFDEIADKITSTRPTAKNLFWSVERMRNVIRLNRNEQSALLFDKLETEALAIHSEDRQMCDNIGRFGSSLIHDGAVIITHCNSGALATGGIGTAFAVLATAHQEGKKIFVYADETRPLLQGARLTMWELEKAGIPSALITDSSAAWTIRSKSVDLIITGADRITANGDTANKIGTYNLAVLAKEHTIPFYIAAPTSTIDLSLPSGSEIIIEERSADEIVRSFGLQTAPDDVAVYAPAFDVTPAALISAIITEHGILRPPYQQSLHAAVKE